ncbi:pseudaminic acid biosynthesis-associated methylase [Lysinibacillus fusiformis]|uniref:Pseudaminic acid biosynthesis-associated methylase n=1 Tax=Lysinibacillus fusiformis TaxID=28031 RepID=A0A1H9M0I8_9BACI|nr:pseudaminic acid biosynthesis-associated methylase [Lysinibacillus fusiformis]SCY58363.1 pseudaminic acid biosynthesis-associated methylase [Lysinibacillus fusiformis]SEO15988.1 pseudaminic acid biosynthesis-associated methylase [Lysinibacillus fusiformis]SER17188.1 pseudaminic acid biosynthesis-associated methylase [Lysinibacillus fusiformis]
MFKTEQEQFWYGEFGNDYLERNNHLQLLSSNISLFSNIISKTENVTTLIEFGANIGLNLKALKTIKPSIDVSGIEINTKAAEILKNVVSEGGLFNESIIQYNPKKLYDFVLIKGVLIHINPNELKNVYKKLYESSSQYICVVEYYSPSPVAIDYRGNKNKLFKRDFAGEIMDTYKDLILVDYGFVYHRDKNFPQDDLTWFLLKKA